MGNELRKFYPIDFITQSPKPQTTIGNDYIYSLLASTADAAATAAAS